jgi:hypothetical protein
MFMAGYTDEDAFDRELAALIPLGDLVADITCPVLYGIGEFDELTQLEQAIASFEKMNAPKEMRVYEDDSQTTTPPFYSPDVVDAINRQAILQVQASGYAAISYQPFPKELVGYSPKARRPLSVQPYPGQVTAGGGHKNGPAFTLVGGVSACP